MADNSDGDIFDNRACIQTESELLTINYIIKMTKIAFIVHFELSVFK
jgi:hypothetical protein